MASKISLKKLKEELSEKKNKNKKVVFTNGCFDIIHAGHVRYLKKARSLGDLLVVGINTDKSVKKIKGEDRPIVDERDRAEVLSALKCVDYVLLFSEPTPIKLITAILPDVLVKGADWKIGEIVGEKVVKANGGSVRRVRLAPGRSTTDIIERIKKSK
ncbi:MAG: D-glycero-beta-D-manno-heptose 1-phosphate adenylyltransferase [Deltaproteobacteria bacterium]|nr:D-glycero-beta-D-manno-heptose 1-phosphate adenylyltransferase [Deltaproteobacteria bacterium]